jgi:hypothetical protein
VSAQPSPAAGTRRASSRARRDHGRIVRAPDRGARQASPDPVGLRRKPALRHTLGEPVRIGMPRRSRRIRRHGVADAAGISAGMLIAAGQDIDHFDSGRNSAAPGSLRRQPPPLTAPRHDRALWLPLCRSTRRMIVLADAFGREGRERRSFASSCGDRHHTEGSPAGSVRETSSASPIFFVAPFRRGFRGRERRLGSSVARRATARRGRVAQAGRAARRRDWRFEGYGLTRSRDGAALATTRTLLFTRRTP